MIVTPLMQLYEKKTEKASKDITSCYSCNIVFLRRPYHFYGQNLTAQAIRRQLDTWRREISN